VVIEGEKPRGIWVLVKEQRMVRAQELPEASLTVVVNGGGNQAGPSSGAHTMRLLFTAVESAVWTLMERCEEWWDPYTLKPGDKGSNSSSPMLTAEDAFGTWTASQGSANDRAYYVHYRRMVWGSRSTGLQVKDASYRSHTPMTGKPNMNEARVEENSIKVRVPLSMVRLLHVEGPRPARICRTTFEILINEYMQQHGPGSRCSVWPSIQERLASEWLTSDSGMEVPSHVTQLGLTIRPVKVLVDGRALRRLQDPVKLANAIEETGLVEVVLVDMEKKKR
jgi:hypothetical protein